MTDLGTDYQEVATALERLRLLALEALDQASPERRPEICASALPKPSIHSVSACEPRPSAGWPPPRRGRRRR